MRENIKSEYIGIALISLISIGLYLNSLNSSFHFDDNTIVENPYIKNLKDIPFFLEGIKVHSQWYRVLPTLSFAINYHFHKLDVFGYHLVNLVLHILSGILVYFISRNLFALALKKIEIPHNHKINPESGEVNLLSLLTAVFFIAHPIQVNTVTYIVERNEGLASLFYLLSFFLFIKGTSAVSKQKILFLLGSGFSFFCSVFSKEIGFTLPIVLILYDLIFICKKRQDILRKIRIYLPLFSFLSIYILFFLKGGMLWVLTEGSGGWRWTPWENLLTQANVLIQYFRLLLLPLPQWLNVDHDFQVSKTLFEYPTLLSVSVILCLLILATILIRKNKLMSFCIYWFFIVLAPTSSIIPIWDIMVEYRLYLSIFSFALILVSSLSYLYQFAAHYYSKKLGQGAVLGISIIILSFYSVITMERNKIFKDELTLWTDAANKSPNKIRCKVNLITAYNQRGLPDQAIATSLEVLNREPRNHNIYIKLGVSYMLMGEYDKAIEKLRTSIQIKSDNPMAFNNLGVVYLKKKDFDQAIAQFKQAISYRHDYAEAYNNLAMVLAMKGLIDEAIKEAREAIKINPEMTECHFNLAKFNESKGWVNEAVREYKEALKLEPKFFEAHYHLGALYTKIENHHEAIRELENALKINPQSGKSYFLLGVNFIKTRNREKAISSLEKALQYATNEKDRTRIESVLSRLRLLPG